jgi:hypothetical protein
MSLEKSRLTDCVGELTTEKLRELDNALLAALGIQMSVRPPNASGQLNTFETDTR